MPQAKTGKIVKLYNWNSTNKEWEAWDGTLSTGDISIGAVEIKDQSSDTRASVGSDGLEVEVKKSALPTNASTETRQDDIKGVLDDVVVSLADLVKIGKAEDAVHASSDVGIMALSVRKDDAASTTGTDGDYAALVTNENGILRTQGQQHYHLACCGSTSGWTVLGNDTTSLATTTNHVFGSVALEFDKVNGAANTKLAGIQKTVTSVSMSAYHKGGGFFLWSAYMSDISDVDYCFLRVGTDSTNYNEWRVDEDELSAGWNTLKRGMDAPSTYLGNGWNSAAITYIAVGVAFNAETDALADIAVDHIAANSGLFTTSEILQETTPNINLHKVGNKVVNTQAGDAGTGTQRVSISTDDVNLSAIKTAIEIIDDWDDTNYCNVNLNVAGTDVAANSGNKNAQTQRVVLATDDINTAAIKTAVQLIDDVVYVDDADWTNSTSKHALVGGLYQSTPQDVTDGDVAPSQCDSHGNIKSVITDGTDIALVDGSGNLMCSLGTTISGEDVTNDVLKVEHQYSITYQAATGANVVIKASAGFLHAIILGKWVTGGTVEVSDHASDGDGNVKVFLQSGATDESGFPKTILVDANFDTGITTDLIGCTNVSFIWR